MQRITEMIHIAFVASLARIALATIALERARRLVECAIDGKVVSIHARTRARFARYALQRCTVEARLASFAVRSGRVRSASVAHAIPATRVA